MSDYLNRIMNQNQSNNDGQDRDSELKRIQDRIQRELPSYVPNNDLFGVTDDGEKENIKGHMRQIAKNANTFLRQYEIEKLVDTLFLEITSLGKLSPLMEDPTISEIMVNKYNEIWVERNGRNILTNIKYDNDQQLLELAQRIARNVGRQIDQIHPYVDARLPDGSRVHIIIPPASRKGTTITIRKFFKEKIGIEDLIKFNTLTPEMARFLKELVFSRANIMVSGGTGSGKTTTLNIISNFIPDSERIITIEDSAELQLYNAHIVSLETKDSNSEGRGQVTIQDLVKNSLRMYPKRIIIGELRDFVAYDFLQAANTGHEGSMSTVHSNNPDDCISRLTSLVMEGGIYKDPAIVSKMVGNTLDIIVQITRMRDGKRRIEYISEVRVDPNGKVTTHPIFEYKIEKVTKENQVIGDFVRTDYNISDNLRYKFKQNGIEHN